MLRAGGGAEAPCCCEAVDGYAVSPETASKPRPAPTDEPSSPDCASPPTRTVTFWVCASSGRIFLGPFDSMGFRFDEGSSFALVIPRGSKKRTARNRLHFAQRRIIASLFSFSGTRDCQNRIGPNSKQSKLPKDVDVLSRSFQDQRCEEAPADDNQLTYPA